MIAMKHWRLTGDNANIVQIFSDESIAAHQKDESL